MNEPVHVTDAAFEKTVIQSELPVIVDFLGSLVRALQDGRAYFGQN